MNTRRYPRTLLEAFPRTTTYACAIEVGHRPFWWRVSQFLRRFF